MTKIQLLGSKTLAGKYFIDKNKRKFKNVFPQNFDLNEIYSNNLGLPILSRDSFKNSYLISFLPVWVTSDFINKLLEQDTKLFTNLKGIIIHSSTSVITKRYSINNQDKTLIDNIKNSEDRILFYCKKYKIKCRIIRHTIIYGQYKNLSDNNH